MRTHRGPLPGVPARTRMRIAGLLADKTPPGARVARQLDEAAVRQATHAVDEAPHDAAAAAVRTLPPGAADPPADAH